MKFVPLSIGDVDDVKYHANAELIQRDTFEHMHADNCI